MTPAEGRRQRRELMRQIDREHKLTARRKLAELVAALRDARALRKGALVQARQRCLSERIAARARAREMWRVGLEALRQAVKQERLTARQACSADLAAARGIADKIGRARAELEAERRFRRDMQRIERGNRARMLEFKATSKKERRSESDDEVRGNIPPELASLWGRVKGQIKGSERMTRTEAFLHYAHEHPDEVLVSMEDKTDELVRQLEERERGARRELRRRRPTRTQYREAFEEHGVPF